MIIEFLGPPRSGKSHQIALLKERYLSLGKTVVVIEDRDIEKEITVPVSVVLEYNLLFFNKVFEKLIHAKFITRADIIILDRGFYDAPVWFYTEFLNKNLDKEKLDSVMKFYELLQQFIDKTILIDSAIDISLKRHKHAGIFGETDAYIANEHYLGLMKQAYLFFKEPYVMRGIVYIDGNQTIDEVTLELVSALQETFSL